MEHLGENPHIKFPFGGHRGFKVVKMSVGDHKILNYVAKKRKGAWLKPFMSIFAAVLPANTTNNDIKLKIAAEEDKILRQPDT